jgi:hypothetical protein
MEEGKFVIEKLVLLGLDNEFSFFHDLRISSNEGPFNQKGETCGKSLWIGVECSHGPYNFKESRRAEKRSQRVPEGILRR